MKILGLHIHTTKGLKLFILKKQKEAAVRTREFSNKQIEKLLRYCHQLTAQLEMKKKK